MKPIQRQWYACRLVTDFLGFKKGEVVYIRKGVPKLPLKGGPYFILFRTKKALSCKFFESMGVKEVVSMWPNRVNPIPASPEKNAEIEEAFRMYLIDKPQPKRYDPAEQKRIAALRAKLESKL